MSFYAYNLKTPGDFEPDQPEPCPLNDHIDECESCPDYNDMDALCNRRPGLNPDFILE